MRIRIGSTLFCVAVVLGSAACADPAPEDAQSDQSQLAEAAEARDPLAGQIRDAELQDRPGAEVSQVGGKGLKVALLRSRGDSYDSADLGRDGMWSLAYNYQRIHVGTDLFVGAAKSDGHVTLTIGERFAMPSELKGFPGEAERLGYMRDDITVPIRTGETAEQVAKHIDDALTAYQAKVGPGFEFDRTNRRTHETVDTTVLHGPALRDSGFSETETPPADVIFRESIIGTSR